ncbi:MAG: tRNA pseudouridine(13) synthase TruD [Desulfuromonas sp.]|nr:MAG: tRNA pseudouridine(13) synthase TruD [Desulfuromonas sp.]
MADFLTAALPGTGGRLKQQPEDFAVEEIPLYLPCGEGEHLYLEIEKRGLTTLDVVHRLAKHCRLKERDISYAGLKDAQALTRQRLCLPARNEKHLETLDIPGLRILSSARHRNKLRLGHLAGNRFRIRVHGAVDDAAARATTIINELQTHGVPNLFGEQRYGLLGNNPHIGGALLRGQHQQAVDALLGDPQQIQNPRWREGVEFYRAGSFEEAARILPPGCRNEKSVLNELARGKSCEQALKRLPRNAARLFLSAWQSQLFDRLVQQRLTSLGQLEVGDLAYKHVNGACFLVEDQETEQPRATAFEISPTAPLFGAKVRLAEGGPGERERELLESEALPEHAFKLPGGLSLQGERRPLRVPLEEPTAASVDGQLEVSFALPRGSYATTVMREIMKN